MKSLVYFFLFLIPYGLVAQSFGVPEIPVQNLGDVARAVWSPQHNGAIIVYDPVIVAQIGPLATAFVEAHEIGHVRLGHVTMQFLARNQGQRITMDRAHEIEADMFATDMFISRPDVLRGFISVITGPMANFGDATHLPTAIRAQQIAARYFQKTGVRLF